MAKLFLKRPKNTSHSQCWDPGTDTPMGQSDPPAHLRRFTGLHLPLAQVLWDPHTTLSPRAVTRTSLPALTHHQQQSYRTAFGLLDFYASPRISQGKAKVLIYGFVSKRHPPLGWRKTCCWHVKPPSRHSIYHAGEAARRPHHKSHNKL